jgi:septum formation protein
MPDLILASTSWYRQQLLRDAGIPFRAVSSGVDERAVTIARPDALARELARQKALAVARREPEAWVLGADQVAFHLDDDGRPASGPFGKPADPEDHLRTLRAMVGRRHALLTAFTIVGPGIDVQGDETTVMWVRSDLEEDELRAYVATGEGSDCAGGYAAESRGVFLFERIEGDWSNVVGLPVLRVLGALRAAGWRFR